MNDREKWRERDTRAGGKRWWWWHQCVFFALTLSFSLPLSLYIYIKRGISRIKLIIHSFMLSMLTWANIQHVRLQIWTEVKRTSDMLNTNSSDDRKRETLSCEFLSCYMNNVKMLRIKNVFLELNSERNDNCVRITHTHTHIIYIYI